MADDFNGMDPGFVNALQGLMGACGLSLTSGYRTHDEQARLYAQKPNLAAPPGRSNHERGMAADIAGNLDCAHARAAEFGLRFPMDYEPWHIEPANMDRTQVQDPPAPNDPLPSIAEAVFGSAVPSRAFALDPQEMTDDTNRRVAAGQDPQDAKVAAKQAGMAASEQTATPQTGAVTQGDSLSTEQIARAYAAAGFTGEQLVTMVAIALGESGGNPQARNLNGSEDSRGLSQINTYAHPQYDPDRLYDPNYNAQAAFEVSGGGQNFGPWTVYSKGIYQKFMDQARAAVAAIGGGGGPTAVAATPAAAPTPETDLSNVLDTPGGGLIGPKKLRDSGGLA